MDYIASKRFGSPENAERYLWNKSNTTSAHSSPTKCKLHEPDRLLQLQKRRKIGYGFVDYVTIFGRNFKSKWGRLSSVRCKYTLVPETWKTVYWKLTCRYKSHERILLRSSYLKILFRFFFHFFPSKEEHQCKRMNASVLNTQKDTKHS
jgi:hypothetical protein